MIIRHCPICTDEIELRFNPYRWVHQHGVCTSPGYEKLCDPHPFAGHTGDGEPHDRIRNKARQQQYAARTRGRPNSGIQRLRDDDYALARPERPHE